MTFGDILLKNFGGSCCKSINGLVLTDMTNKTETKGKESEATKTNVMDKMTIKV